MPLLSRPCGLCPSEDTSPIVLAPPDEPQSDMVRTVPAGHPMVTRAKDGIYKPCLFVDITTYWPSFLLHALLTTFEPKGFKSAAKHPGWLAAMNDELTTLHCNKTWELVP